jgi:hypothetical protein
VVLCVKRPPPHGKIVFLNNFGELIPENGYRHLPRRKIVIDLKKKLEDRFIHAQTCVTRWEGESIDRHLALGLLCDLDARLS